MRLNRLAFVFAAVYFALIGGGVYYYQLFPIRVLHHAVVTILLLVWLMRRRALPATPLNGVIAALIGVWIVTAVLSLNPRSAFENLWFPLTHVVMFFIIADLIGRGRESLVLETFFLVSALIALLALAQLVAWYTGIDLIPEPGVGWLNVGAILPPEAPMLYVPLGVSTWLAGFAAPALIASLGWALSSAKQSYRVVFFGLTGALLVVLIGAFSRGGFVAAAAGVAALIGLRAVRALLRDRSRRLIGWLIPAALLIAVVLGVVFVIGRSEARATGDDLRFSLWSGAALLMTHDPLTGVGPGLFGRAYREIRAPNPVDDRLSTAHNAYLNNAAETGLPGVLVMIAFGVVIGARWWYLWRRADSPARQARLEGAFAALIALGLQSVFDTFLITPLVLLSLVLIAYCVIEPGSLLNVTPSRWNRAGAFALMGIIGAYGIAFIQIDRAHALFNRSVRENDLDAARAAHDLDPYMHLYDLQIAYLSSDAAAYARALTLEPTWDTGWINLAGLREAAGDIEGALDALTRAMNIRYANAGAFNWARIADAHDAAPDADILYHYQVATYYEIPLSDLWMLTERRRAALETMMRDETYALTWRYRIAALRDPVYAESLVQENPTTAAEWWIAGESALRDDPQAAARAFTEAIRLEQQNGDYYVSRARADHANARRDLNTADMLTTRHEYPNAVRALLAESPEERERYQAAAVPPRIIDQNFEGVLFQGRVASFQVLPSMRTPGLETGALQPWYDLAADYAANGFHDAAANVYRAILDVAPYETRAAQLLEANP